MLEKLKNNQATISGEIVSEFTFSNEVFGEKFYIAKISSERESGTKDTLKLLVSEKIVDVKKEWKGKFVRAYGQLRSYNSHEENKSRLLLSVFAREIEVWEEDGDVRPDDKNHVFLDGYVCKKPVYRETPLGREITEVLLTINRPYGKSDYIPCICWGRNAKFAENFEVGAHISIEGRFQSREYRKCIGEEEYETRTAYEVSVSKIEE